MNGKRIQEKEKVNLQLKNKKKVQSLKEKGITLIALVVTIIILLILAGVTLNIALSGDGLFNKAKLAVNKYDVASEQEVLQQQIIEYKMDNSIEKIGEKLSDKVSSVIDSNWKVIQLNNSDKNYGTNYYYIEKGTKIANYGQAKYNWVMNYETEEVINIEGYKVLDGNAGMSVTDNLALNINPINLSDKNLWGSNVKFVYGKDENSANSGVHETEIRFDGIDDYLIIDSVDIGKDNQLTLEFYGQFGNKYAFPLEALKMGSDGLPCGSRGFITGIFGSNDVQLCQGDSDSKSSWAIEGCPWWLKCKGVDGIEKDNDIYISLSINYSSGVIDLYYESKNRRVEESFNDL